MSSQKLSKYIYKHFALYDFNKCGHFLYALKNKMLDTELDEIYEFNPSDLSEYFDMADMLEGDLGNEINDAIKFFIKLKNKVKLHYENLNKTELEGYQKDFQLFYEGMGAVFDYIKIDKENKTIDFILIKPSTIGQDLDKILLSQKNFNKKAKIFIEEYGNPSLTEDDLWNHKFLPISMFYQASKKKHPIDMAYLMTLLIKKYPGYRIYGHLPLIEKDFNPYFEDLIFKYEITSHLDQAIKKYLLETSQTFLKDAQDDRAQSFELPKWRTKFPTNKKCVYCYQEKEEEKILQNYNSSYADTLLQDYPDKIAMIDFETINDPLPEPDYFKPYDRIAVQISVHLMDGRKDFGHKEYIVKDLSKKEMSKIYDILVEVTNSGYKLVAYYSSFEAGCIRVLERILKRYEISSKYNIGSEKEPGNPKNPKLLDLFDFFSKQSKKKLKEKISLNRFGPSASIKKTIELYAGDNNPYKNLNINNGFAAMAELYERIVEGKVSKRKEIELLKYCKQDTYTMVELYRKILEIHNSSEDKTKILSKLDKEL